MKTELELALYDIRWLYFRARDDWWQTWREIFSRESRYMRELREYAALPQPWEWEHWHVFRAVELPEEKICLR